MVQWDSCNQAITLLGCKRTGWFTDPRWYPDSTKPQGLPEMKSGAINLIVEDSEPLARNPDPLTRSEGDETCSSVYQLTRGGQQGTLTSHSESGEVQIPIQEGTVYREEPEHEKTRRIAEDGALETERDEMVTRVEETDFTFVNNEFLITQRTGADQARSIISQYSSSRIKESRIDVASFYEAHSDLEPFLEWASGIDGKLCVIDDASTGDEIRQRLDESERDQMSFRALSWQNRVLSGTITRSGYIELYGDRLGGSITTTEFAQFVDQEVLDHTSIAE